MRWKISPWKPTHSRDHYDPRHIDLIAILVLVIAVVAACRILSGNGYQPPSKADFIVPSQSVHW